jgi:hypothetical protein
MQGWFNLRKSINIIYTYSESGTKATWSSQEMQKTPSSSFHDKSSEELGTERTYFNIIKAVYDKLVAKYRLQCEISV